MNKLYYDVKKTKKQKNKNKQTKNKIVQFEKLAIGSGHWTDIVPLFSSIYILSKLQKYVLVVNERP